ncbi:hypothetical protein B566_EDAN004339 [Ephemera danica]|nr:hypothetical protein B566_EDAN004339 [Ephemera danica]
MAEFGTGKTIFILAIVVGCFAILWPKIFYPMLLTSISGTPPHPSVPPVDNVEANLCCDVIFETDVTAIKVLTEMCGHILDTEHQGPLQLHVGHLPKAVVERCREEVLSACGLDIAAVIRDNVRLTKNYKQILDDIRSYNNSACLKRNFGLQLSLLGTPRQMNLFKEKHARHLRPERPAHLHPDMLHPALREKGRAIPQQQPQKPLSVGAITGLDGSPPRQPGHPMPGMRPPMGGAGHVVAAPKGSGTMGIIMPLYTVGIVVFFVYTIMKVIFKKTEDRSKYPEFGIDPELRRMMFGAAAMEECAAAAQNVAAHDPRRATPEPAAHHANGYRAPVPAEQRPSTKLGDVEMDQLRRRLEETEAAMERIVAQMGTAVEPRPPHKTVPLQEEERQSETEEVERVEQKPSEGDFIEQEVPVEEKQPEPEVAPVEQEVEQEVEESKPEAEDEQDFKDEEMNEMQQLKDDLEDTKDDLETKEDLEDKVEEKVNGHVTHQERTTTPVQLLLEEGSGQVTVLGMETTAQCEGGQKWTGRPPTPDTPPRCTTPSTAHHPLAAIEQFVPPPPPPPPPHHRWARPPTPPTPPRSATPLAYFSVAPHSYLLETSGIVAPGGQHGILVSDSECEAVPVPHGDPETEDDDEDSPPVILSGKMTLSVISLPEAPPTADHSSTPASPVLPRRMMHVQAPPTVQPEQPQHVADNQGASSDERVKAPSEAEVAVNGTVDEDESCNKPLHALSNGGGLQQDEITTTNYTTASAAAAEEAGIQGGERQEETSADISGIDDEHAEAADIDEPVADVEDLPEDEDPPPQGLHGQSNGML